MKLMNLYILGGALLLFIILTASCACCDFKPYSKKVSFSKYEGMTDGETLDEDEEKEGFDDEDEEKEGFDDEDEEKEGFDDEDEEKEGFDDENEEKEGFDNEYVDEQFGPYKSSEAEEEEKPEKPQGVMSEIKNSVFGKSKEGMKNNLEPRPYSEHTLYDIYGPPTKGSLDCGARSAGLTNSKGPLCLSDKQLNMLRTRGGNSNGDSQIGA